MEVIGYILMGLFLALLLGAALTFGFALLAVGMGVAIGMAFIVALRQAWWRWRFLRSGERPKESVEVIEVDYEDISDRK